MFYTHISSLLCKIAIFNPYCNSTKKRQHYFGILKAFVVRHSSEYKTSDSDRKVNRNIYPDTVTREPHLDIYFGQPFGHYSTSYTSDDKSFQYATIMLPLFLAVAKFCKYQQTINLIVNFKYNSLL